YRRQGKLCLRDIITYFHGHQLVELLSPFILQDEKAKRDIFETKNYIEMDCLRLALHRIDSQKIEDLNEWVKKADSFNDDTFFYRIIENAQNHLFLRIWVISKEYYNSLHSNLVMKKREDYLFLLAALAERNEEKTLSAYVQLRNLNVNNDKY
ncbi:MAG: FadR family transcriptional regulator, partial [Bacillus sp. (in: Bacteria)]|nr:FadR family transcriptional regulator [Bacillus sp. (in: firmicutes)]